MLVAAVALAACLAGIGNDLVQDDFSLLVESDRLQGFGHWREILTSAYWPLPHSPDLYRPLTSLLLAAEYALGNGSPLVIRAGSYLLYAATAVGVFHLAARMLPGGIALTAALLFAAHPVHVEAVALGVGQSELLVALFGIPMVLRYVAKRRSQSGLLSWRDWCLVALLYLAAGLSKEQGLILPVILIGAELTLLVSAEPWSLRIRRLGAGYLLLAAAGLGILLARRAVLGDLAGTFTASALQGLDVWGRGLTMLAVVPRWVQLLVWPLHLQADYSPAEISASLGLGWNEALGLGLVIAALAAIWLTRRKVPVVSFGLVWIAVSLFPVSNLLIPTGIVLAERTLFLPSIGFVLALGGGGAVGAVLARKAFPLRIQNIAAAGIVAAVTSALVVRSADRHRDWRSDTVLRIRSAEDAPKSWRTQLSYASYLFDSGPREPALERYRRALDLAPAAERWRVRNDLAEHFFAKEEADQAVEQLRASLADAPGQEVTRHYLVLGYLALGKYLEAAAEADSARAHGGSPAVFDELRVLADSARRLGVPPGGIKIRVRPMGR